MHNRTLPLLVLATSLACTRGTALKPSSDSASAELVNGRDSVAFVALSEHSPQRDCSSPDIPFCRVRSRVSGSALRSLLARGIHVVQTGDTLTFFEQSAATSMSLQGGLQYPMSRVVGTDIYVVALRLTHADEAVISYTFIPDVLTPGTKLTFSNWRGPAAPAPPIKSISLAGRLRTDTLQSPNLGASRVVFSYVPPTFGNEPIAGVVYMGDGGAVKDISQYVDTLIVEGLLPRVMLVGTMYGMPGPKDPPGTDVRSLEYLWGAEASNERFLAHERFVLEEVIPWAEATLGAPATRSKRAVWGISNSGGWAITMGLRHPDVLSVVLAFSPARTRELFVPGTSFTPPVRFLLQGGTFEPTFRRTASDWSDSLRVRGVSQTFKEIRAGHDALAWSERFPEAIRWAWGQ